MFPAAAAAWRLSEEPFLKNVGWLSDLKVRVSYGKTGNQAFPNYLQYAAYLYGNPQAQVQFGNQFLTTIRPGAKNPNLKWESTGSLDVGFDFGLSNQRFTGTIDWYDRKTSDMLFFVPVDPVTNLSNFVWKNIGSMRNRGIEMSLRAQLMNGGGGGLAWSADFTMGHNTNTVLSINPADSVSQIPRGLISGGVGNTVQVLTPGQPFDAFFFDDAEELALRFDRQLRHRIEIDDTTARELEATRARRHGIRERAALVSEELRIDQRRRQACAVDRDERQLRARTARV